ncbi:MAG: rhomboid family intramembrane serine protease [Halanaerobiales bacterium]
MLSDLYYRKKLGVPFITYILVLTCLLVTIPSYLNPIWYDVFGGAKYPLYFWQHFTHHFQHGNPYPSQLHTLLHLAGNILVALSCGILAERVLGTKKFFILTFATVIVSIFYKFFNFYGNGASGIVWAYSAVAFYILVLLFKRAKRKLLKEPVFYFFVFVLIIIWIVITLVSYSLGWHNTNIIHLGSTLTGLLFTYIWRKDIANVIEKKLVEKNSKTVPVIWDKRIIALALILPLFIISVYSFSAAGIFDRHILAKNILPVSGSSITTINETNGKVIIHFKEEMKGHIDSTSKNISWSSESGKLKSDFTWVDHKTLEISFNRELEKGDKINIILQGFYVKDGQYLAGNVCLYYE